MKLATIETIKHIEKHPNADALEIVQVLNYRCVVKLGQYQLGEKVVFIQPDTVLPDAPWTAFYKAKSSRVRAIKLRGVWSMGIVEKLESVGLEPMEVGEEVSALIGVVKYEAPMPQDLSAKGLLPFSMPKTDEERWQNLEDIRFGEKVDVTLKIDGQSLTVYAKKNEDGTFSTGVCGRSLEFKDDAVNSYTRIAAQYGLVEKVKRYAELNNTSIALRGESYGIGIQANGKNPHAKQSPSFALFSVFLIDELVYARKGSPHYFYDVAEQLDIPTVPIFETNVPLTRELIRHYDEGVDTLNGQAFEGVVINGSDFSFKVMSKYYDACK